MKIEADETYVGGKAHGKRGRGAESKTPVVGMVQRGGKIFASGTEKCQIVFTADADPMDGTFPVTSVGQWGGVVLLGKANVNLTVAANTTSGTTTRYCAGADGTGFIEGFSGDVLNGSGVGMNIYGGGTTPDEDDNSGILKYVSIRYAGDVLPIVAGTAADGSNELNGLSLGAVGRGTTIEHIEVISSADDNIEFFGGTVNVKYVTTMFGADDMFDFDLGYKGKVQYYFGIKTATNDTTLTKTADNGIEADADDDKANPPHALRSHPIFYNCTFVGNGRQDGHADNTGPAAIQAKELTEGEFYNSVFVNFRSGLHLATNRNATFGDAYDNWTNATTAYNNGGTGVAVKNSLIVKNNTFVGCTNAVTTGKLNNGNKWDRTDGTGIAFKQATLGSAADITQFNTTDGNVTIASLTGMAGTNYTWSMASTTNNIVSAPFDLTPTANLTSTITAPADGFFSPVSYRGAFDASKPSWLSGWAYATLLKTSAGLQDNPTDINKDGITNGTDFGLLLAKYGQANK